MSNLKSLAGQTAIYGLSSILGRSVNFLLIIVYTTFLSEDAIGAFTGIYALIGFLNIVFTFGMETTFFRFATGKNLDATQVYNTTQSLLVTTSLILGSTVFLLAPFLAEWMDYPGQAYLFRWMALILCFDAIMAIPFARLRLRNQAWVFAGAKLLNITLNVGLNIILIVVFPQMIEAGTLQEGFLGYRTDWGVEYILLANLLANGLIIPLVWWKAGFFSFKLNGEILKPMWEYAFPLLFMGLAGVTNDLVSRLLFEYLLPADFYPGLTSRQATGIFGANFKLAVLMNLVIQAFKYAAEPFFFKKASDPNSPQLYAKVTHGFIIFTSVLMVAISVNLNWIGPLFLRQESYSAALYIVPVLLMGYLLLGVYFNISIWFKVTDRTSYSLWITLAGALTSILVIFLMVPRFGYIGAALSTLASYSLLVIICYFFGQKFYPIPYPTLKLVFYLILGFVLSYAGFYLEMDNEFIGFIVRNSVVLAMLGGIYLLERKDLLMFLKKKN